jgi:hypothetical protein
MELIGGLDDDFCSPECDAGQTPICVFGKSYFAEGCTLCTEGSAAPVDGKCPPPGTGPYLATAKTLTGGNGDF